MDPVLLEIFNHRFAAVAEEMGVTLKRTAYSPNIKERRDFSCAIFDARGGMIAQAAHIPVHLGSMPLSVAAAVEGHKLADGDMVVLNDPFNGGTHLPDVTLVAPVFAGGDRPLFFVANRAHHSDIGGMSAGSMPMSRSIFQEGLIIPPTKIIERGQVNPELMRLILTNVRTPDEREGDFTAQITANLTGIARMIELIDAFGQDTVCAYAAHLIDYAETLTRQRIAEIPDGRYAFEDVMEDDGAGTENIRIRVRLSIDGDEAEVDFSETDDQVPGCINSVYAVTLSCVFYAFRSLIKRDMPTNAGCLRPLTVKTRKGSLVDARFPAAVAAGNVETSQRTVDVVLGALAEAIPDQVPAAAQGTMNNITIGGIHPDTGKPFTYYETIGGGMGASAGCDGASAVHSHMTNTLNTPAEAIEYAYPFQITRCAVRRGSGGKGRFSGGDGIIREIRMLGEADVTVLSERRKTGPYGLMGGETGRCGENVVTRGSAESNMPGKFQVQLSAGDKIRIETPGGGGCGG